MKRGDWVRTMSLLMIVWSIGSAAAGVSDSRPPIVDVPVSFHVRNVNRSAVPCLSDGAAYEIRGHLVAPLSLVTGSQPKAAMLWLHAALLPHTGLWHLTVDGDDTWDLMRQMAYRGHASVSIDFPGYGESPIPPGTNVCQGSYADIAHQVVQALRTGDYRMDGGAVAFDRIAIGGLSSGAWTAQIEAYSFHDVDALVVMSWAEPDTLGPSATLWLLAAGVYGDSFEPGGFAVSCVLGGERKYGSTGPGGYAWTAGHDPRNVATVLVHDAEPKVVDAAIRLGERDPCAERESAPQVWLANVLLLSTVDVPVLLLFGEEDGLIDWPEAAGQKNHFTGSPDVTLLHFAGSGHALPLERTAPRLLHPALSAWFTDRGF